MPSLSPWKVGNLPGRGKLSSLSSDVDENQLNPALQRDSFCLFLRLLTRVWSSIVNGKDSLYAQLLYVAQQELYWKEIISWWGTSPYLFSRTQDGCAASHLCLMALTQPRITVLRFWLDMRLTDPMHSIGQLCLLWDPCMWRACRAEQAQELMFHVVWHTFIQTRIEGTTFQSHKRLHSINILNERLIYLGCLSSSLIGVWPYLKWQLIIKNISILSSSN